MGMFDSVWAVCPSCGIQVEFQSKAGDCVLASFAYTEVPVGIAVDIAGKTKQCKCGKIITIRYPKDTPIVINMLLD